MAQINLVYLVNESEKKTLFLELACEKIARQRQKRRIYCSVSSLALSSLGAVHRPDDLAQLEESELVVPPPLTSGLYYLVHATYYYSINWVTKSLVGLHYKSPPPLGSPLAAPCHPPLVSPPNLVGARYRTTSIYPWREVRGRSFRKCQLNFHRTCLVGGILTR